MTDLLQQGIAAAQAGKREESRALLTSVVEADERNEQAWLWLAGVVDDPDDVRTCLQNVLDLNPANQQAQKGLAWLEARDGPPAAAAAVAVPAQSEIAPPASAPIVTPAAIGPTTNLAAEVALPAPARPAAAPSAVSEPLSAEPLENPCPYCGAPTTLAQQTCAQCRGDLMLRSEPREKRSLPLTILGGLWVTNGVFTVIGSVLGAVGALLLYLQVQSAATRINPKASVPFPTTILVPIVISLLLGIGIVQIARALLRRERWAYFLIIGLSVLGFAATLFNFARIGSLTSALTTPGAFAQTPTNQRVIASIIAAAGAIAICTLAFQALYLLLIALSYRDFFGPMLRFNPAVEPAEDVKHYNNGITYKNRGMLYMAMQEWQAALKKQPQDKNYLLALGLAYAQLNRLYPRATAFHQDTRAYLVSRKAELYALAPELEPLNIL